MVNGTFAATPFSLHNGSIQVYTSGFSVVISTAFGLLVTYDAYSYVTISVPYDYQNSTCGLCGNFNFHPEDDFRTPSGLVVSSDVDFANSWNTEGEQIPPSEGCSGLQCIDCTEDQKNIYRNSDNCGILSDSSGPFSACHATLSPQVFLENCVYDLCVGGGHQPILCQALNVYASQCQQQNSYIGHWRTPGFCEIQCPAHGHFETQGTSCPATCSDPSAPSNCPTPPQESCICDDGYVLSAGECVPQSSCGCTFEGLYYTNGQSVVLGEDCSRQCTCNNMVMTCQNHQCGEQEVCAVHNGVRGCRPSSYSTCLVDNLGYHTYDGLTFSYPGACQLVLSKVLHSSPRPNFNVTVENVPSGPEGFTKWLHFEAEGTLISVEMKEGGMMKVDGQMVAVPMSINSGRLLIYHSSVKGVIIETSFGLTVRADWPNIIRITAPNNYNGTLAGLCGNFNNIPDDEFSSPSGVLLNDAQEFGDSWRVGSLSAYCVENERLGEQGYYSNSSQFHELCGIMTSSEGPFAQCHGQINPQEWTTDCIRYLQQTEGAREALCEALRGYAVLCQQNGVAVGEWRNMTNCEFPCPANSHYEACGTSCPAACPSLSFPFLCTQNCQEGCQCDDGLLLSGDQCVPPTGCGCLHEGRYRHGGEQFWSDDQCQSLCVCDGTTGYVSCSSSSCSEQEVCGVVDGEHGCHPRPSATCSASGDPHYTSFDGRRFDFQGTCRYTLAAVCTDTQGLAQFEVVGQNAPWFGLPVSITVGVSVNVSGHLVEVLQNMYGAARIDGETRNLPVLLDSGGVSVYSSGPITFITTDFGLSVTYDGSWVVTVTVPGTYRGTTCGLCGNFNGDSSDDFLIRSGAVVPSVSEFGADWKVQDDTTCSDGGEPSPCQDQSSAQAQCEVIRDSQGPFSLCHDHVDPQPYFDDCVFDVCLFENNNNQAKCDSVQSYAMACQSANARIYPWRDGAACNMVCPENSHYELCGSDCERTCSSSGSAVCNRSCTEGCYCDEGYVRSGGLCVPAQQCGCSYNGFYFNIGESFWTAGCSQQCECFAPNDLRCVAASCTPTQKCEVWGGHLGCYNQMSTCMVTGDPHYYTFDGAVAHFQGTCSYEVSKTCGTELANGLGFRVVATNMHRGSTAVSFVSAVEVWLTQNGEQTHVTIGQNRRVKMDGTSVDSFPADVGHLAELYREQNFVVLNASSELMVYFDGSMTLLVRLSPSLRGSVCGMCGNYNGDAADDKTMSDGAPAPDDTAFGNSWKSDTSGPGCGSTDQPVPQDCPFREDYAEVCSIITNTSGPFQHCHVHVDPQPYFTSCLYDLCSYSWKDMLCAAVEAYDTACTLMEVPVPDWRSDLSCLQRDPCEDLSCTEDEWCGQRNGDYGCFCNENYLRPNPDTYDLNETCESSSGFMSLSRCQLFEAGFPFQNLHLSDPSCRGTLQDGRLLFHFDNDEHICGTNLTANGTHFIYNNYIQGEVDSATHTINRLTRLDLRFSCVYQRSQMITMETELNPIESFIHKTLPGGDGMYRVRMIPYQDAGFSHPYNGSASVEVNQRIYVAVMVTGVDGRQISTVMDSCWATPEKENSTVSWDLITYGCHNEEDRTVEIIENGHSTTGRFSFNMFTFNDRVSKVYLHCRIHLCLLQENNCVPNCYLQNHQPHHRAGRAVDAHDVTSISMGPLLWNP